MDQYYYVDARNQQAGPYSLNDLIAQGITSSTLVWKQGMSGWVPAAQVPEVAAALQRASVPGGGPGVPPPAAGKPADMLVWAILSTVFGCQPLGVVAIIFAAMSRSAVARGEMEMARQQFKRSLIFTIIAAAVGIPFNTLLLIAMMSS